MDLVRFRHKGLKKLFERDDARGIPSDAVDKLRNIFFALETAEKIEQVGRFPGWKLHPLKGKFEGFWSITVTGNRRLIFHFNKQTNFVEEIDLVDYH